VDKSNLLDYAQGFLNIPEEHYQQVETIVQDNFINNGISRFDYSRQPYMVVVRNLYAIIRSYYRHNFTSYDIESYEFRDSLTPKEYAIIKRVYNEGWLYYADCLLRGEEFAEYRYNKTNKESVKVYPKNLDIDNFINKRHEILRQIKQKPPPKKKKKKIKFEKEEDKGGIIKEKLKFNLKTKKNRKSRKKRVKTRHQIHKENLRKARQIR